MPSEKPDFLKIIFFPLLCLSCVLSLIRFSMNIGFQPITALAAFLHRLYSYTSSRLYPCKTYQMGSSGLEPPTSRLSGARSNLLSYEPAAAVPLPNSHFLWLGIEVLTRSFALAYLGFTNLVSLLAFGSFVCFLTSLLCLSGQGDRSFRFTCVMEMMGFEPMTPCLQGRCSPN